jgi:putrescine aminotransferase
VFAPFDRDPYLHTSTLPAAPVAMAAARATIEVIESEGLVQRAGELGGLLLEGLRKAVAAHIGHLVAEVRGAGLLIGVAFHDSGTAAEFLMDLLDNDLIVNHSMNAQSVIRLTPPAVLTDAQAQRVIAAFEAACAALSRRFPAGARA